MPATPLSPSIHITPVDWVQIAAIASLTIAAINFVIQRFKDSEKHHEKDKNLAVWRATVDLRIKHLEGKNES